ncbi:MAG TPA: glycosyltransferase family 39 protein, partial [Ktedonobacteraceae bacterium]
MALVVSIIYNLTVANNCIPIFDAAIYNNLARALVKLHCYCVGFHHPAYFRPPLWPLIIATIYSSAGEHNFYARLFDCLLNSGTCVFIYLLARDLFGKRIALFIGLIAAIYPGIFIWNGWLY